MSDFERSGMTYDEPGRRRSPGTWFADIGDRLARGLNNFDRPAVDEDEGEWEQYDEPEQPTAIAEPIEWDPNPSGHSPTRKRFPTVLHGYDRDAVDAHLAALEQELADMRIHRSPAPAVQDEIDRVGEETSAILRVAHEQAAEITRRAQVQADRCVSDAAANAVQMTEEAKRKLRQLDSETDAVWAERGRLIEDVRSVATSLFSLAEDAADRFPEEADKRAPAHQPTAMAQAAGPAMTTAAAPAPAAPMSAAPASVAAPPRSAPARQASAPARPHGAPQTAAARPSGPPASGPVPGKVPSPGAAAGTGEDSDDLPA